MKKPAILQQLLDAIRDPERDFTERVFLIFSMILESAVPVALLGDIAVGEHLGEIVVLAVVFVLNPTTVLVCLYKNKVRYAIGIQTVGLVFVVLPLLFFLGGGMEGGGILWVIFAFLFVGLVLSGRWRKVILFLLIVMTLIFYLTDYYHPEWILRHSRKVYFVDSFISIVLVGVLCFFMTLSQNRLYLGENERARKETERAEELTRSQNRFFSSMSHEIRTPINSILGLNELILRDTDASEEIVKDAFGIQGAGKLLLSLINDILDFSKIEAGSMDIVPVDYRVDKVLSEMIDMIWLNVYEKGLRLDVSIDPKVPSVLYGDEVRMKQVIMNLLNNAVKYTAEGSVDLHIESEELDQKTAVLTISVSDTGTGIRKEALPYLFDAFKRADETRNRNIEGTGLGLSSVKQLTEMMDGTVTVNSVYGEGSTFTVTVKQGISDSAPIGEMNIHHQRITKRHRYESRFKAPEAAVLLVDDNELNLEVDCRLLEDTQLKIDTVLNGREALQKTLKRRYDVILMDHLMPEMDGIECLKRMRSQTGGLNRTTPVIVLTANAGNDYRALYSRSGFDGYLIKPVTGEKLEEILMKHIPEDKLIISSRMLRMREDINTAAGYARKQPVVITTTSMSDLPDSVLRKLNIPIIPFMIQTEEGIFKDGVQMDANELIRYINAGKNAVSFPPDVKAYMDFFADTLKKAHHVIHISLTTSMSDDYLIASEAARSFDNVTVINSQSLSSGIGILVLIAYRLVQQNIPVDEIVSELNMIKHRLQSSFVIDTTEYMAKKKLIGARVNNIARVLNLHPGLKFRNDKSMISSIWVGNTKKVYGKYIREAFPVDIIPDPEVVFITYADVPMEMLKWVREEISRIAYFENVVYQQASAAITSNCGPGAIGIFYFIKSNKSYNIGAFVKTEDSEEDTEVIIPDAVPVGKEKGESLTVSDVVPEQDEPGEAGWYQKLSFIDAESALKNCGSVSALKEVLKVFYDAVPAKVEELESYYASGQWENYTIKIHALKSSARLIGAEDLADKAQLLENAGREGNLKYLVEYHAPFLQDYQQLRESLTGVMEADQVTVPQRDFPVADTSVMEGIYGKLYEAARLMDYDLIDEAIQEIGEFIIPDREKQFVERILEKVDIFDYEGIANMLDERFSANSPSL